MDCKKISESYQDESFEFVNEIIDYDDKPDVIDYEQIPKEYRAWTEVFSKDKAEQLPPLNSKYQCEINFKTDAKLPSPRKPFHCRFRNVKRWNCLLMRI